MIGLVTLITIVMVKSTPISIPTQVIIGIGDSSWGPYTATPISYMPFTLYWNSKKYICQEPGQERFPCDTLQECTLTSGETIPFSYGIAIRNAAGLGKAPKIEAKLTSRMPDFARK